jgi:hypothetical protein
VEAIQDMVIIIVCLEGSNLIKNRLHGAKALPRMFHVRSLKYPKKMIYQMQDSRGNCTIDQCIFSLKLGIGTSEIELSIPTILEDEFI